MLLALTSGVPEPAEVASLTNAFCCRVVALRRVLFARLPCAAYGTAKSGVGIASMGVMKPEWTMKCIIPVIMAGVLGIYGTFTAASMHGPSSAIRLNYCICFLQALSWPSFSRAPSPSLAVAKPNSPPSADTHTFPPVRPLDLGRHCHCHGLLTNESSPFRFRTLLWY